MKNNKNRINLKSISKEIIAALLIILWIYAGVSKLIDYNEFKFQLGRSPFIENYASLVSIALPIGEIAIAILLVFPKSRVTGLYLSFGLMLLFTGYIYAMLHYSYYTPCSCGGVLSSLTWENHLIFNAAYTIVALIGIILETYKKRELSIVNSI